MAFELRLAFTSDSARSEFLEHALPRNRAHLLGEPPSEVDDDGRWNISIGVGSAAAAREVCHRLVAFLAHKKSGGVLVLWTGADGSSQTATLQDGANRDAEILSTRLATAARAALSDSAGADDKAGPK